MAQWMGQFSGRTHESKIKDIEETLLTAIESLKSADETNIDTKRKTVIKLCERLMSARHKALKARISKISETLSLKGDSKNIQNLIEREKKSKENGIAGIFAEYKIQDLVK